MKEYIFKKYIVRKMANGKNKILQKILKHTHTWSVYVTSLREKLFYNFYLITFILKFKFDNIIAEITMITLVGK